MSLIEQEQQDRLRKVRASNASPSRVGRLWRRVDANQGSASVSAQALDEDPRLSQLTEMLNQLREQRSALGDPDRDCEDLLAKKTGLLRSATTPEGEIVREMSQSIETKAEYEARFTALRAEAKTMHDAITRLQLATEAQPPNSAAIYLAAGLTGAAIVASNRGLDSSPSATPAMHGDKYGSALAAAAEVAEAVINYNSVATSIAGPEVFPTEISDKNQFARWLVANSERARFEDGRIAHWIQDRSSEIRRDLTEEKMQLRLYVEAATSI